MLIKTALTMGKRLHIVLPRLSDFMGATFALLFTAALLPIGCTFASTVYVSSDSHCNDTLCCTLPSPSPNTPCCSLSWVVDHCLGNNTEVIFLGENYDFNETVLFIGYGNIALRGSKQVVVKCELDAGLSFIQCHDILIMGIEFKNCGTLQNSTSHDFNDSRILFKPTHVAMYFQFCLNIELMLVSSRGIGVVITLGAHAQRGYGSWVCVCLSVCLSVTLHLTSRMFVRLTNDTTCLTGNEGQKYRTVFSDNAPLRENKRKSQYANKYSLTTALLQRPLVDDRGF